MDNILDIVEEPGPDIKESTIVRYIWFHPTACYRYILKHIPGKHVDLLFMLGGFTNAINEATQRDALEIYDFWIVFLVAGIFGALAGWVLYYILAWATHATGKWMNAKGSVDGIRTVLAWSLIPNILGHSVVLLSQLVIFGSDLFSSDIEVESMAYSVALVVFGIVMIVLGFWSLVILVRGVALVHEFSAGRAFLNVIIPYLILIGFAVILSIIYLTVAR